MKNIIIGLVLLVCIWKGYSHFTNPQTESSTESSGMPLDQVHALAATVKAEEVEMYTTTECPYCQEAKAWLNQYGFAFTECNMSLSDQCINEFKDYGANGTPFLVIRRGNKVHQMKDGFDTREFLTALQQ